MSNKPYIKKVPHSEILKLENIVPVDPGQVSSMTLVQRPSLGITLISLAKGEALKSHASPGDAMVQILSGVAEITIDQDVFTVSKGELIVMPADIPHGLEAKEAFQMLLTVVKPESI
jgi:Uncharacterized conserved protein, contains double-stranded beta-helix domain